MKGCHTFLPIIYKITRAPTNWIAAIGWLHAAVTRSNNRASRPPSWYLLQCEASQLEAEMSDEEYTVLKIIHILTLLRLSEPLGQLLVVLQEAQFLGNAKFTSTKANGCD